MTAPSLGSWEVVNFAHTLSLNVLSNHHLCNLIISLVWLLVGSVGIIPIYNSIIKNSIGIDVSNTVTNAVNSVVGETGIGEIPTAAPSVRDRKH